MASHQSEAPTLNVENIMRVRDHIAGLPAEQFRMCDPGRLEDAENGTCGTAACIAGWTRAIFRDPTPGRIEGLGVRHFGVSDDAASTLFFPGGWEMADGASPYAATPADAVAVLDHLIATGEVDWSVARRVEG